MSNLSELLPSGGGQNVVEFTASGTLSSGQAVALQSDGTVIAVSQSGPGTGTSTTFQSVANADTIASVFDTSNNKVVIVYRDGGNSSYGIAVVGTVSGTSISFGTPVVFEASAVGMTTAAFDSTSNKVVIAYRDDVNSNYGTAIVGTVSGTSISFGTAVVFESATTNYIACSYSPANNKTIISYRDGGNLNYGTSIVGTVSGTSISFGSAAVFEYAHAAYMSSTFDTSQNVVIVVYADIGNSFYGTAVVGTVSGTSISFGTPAVFLSATAPYPKITFDSSNNKPVIAYYDTASSNNGKARVATVSGTSISFGTAATFASTSADQVGITFDSSTNNIHIAYADASAANVGKVVIGAVSGTSLSFGTPVTFTDANIGNTSLTFDNSNNKTVIAYSYGGTSIGTSSVFFELDTNSADFIGITAEAISDTATGPVNVKGGINEVASPALAAGAESNLTGKTQSPYPVITYDITNSKFVVFFQDGNNSNYGTSVVVTVSGTTVTFGTPVVFNSGSTNYIDATYSESNGKHLVVYPDYGNSQQATAIVGTVSGTSISFGSEQVYDTGTANTRVSVAYNSNLDKYLAGSTPSSGTINVTVLTVSGTTVSAGTPVSLSGTKYLPNIASNESASDFVLGNNKNDNQSEAHLISVSGTVPTVETSTDLSAVVSTSYPRTGLAFLESNKFVCVYSDNSTNSMYTRTITVSGTSLSLGTASSAFTVDPNPQTNINGAWPLFKATTTSAYLYYQDDTSNYLKYVPISISGTTATSGTEVTYTSQTSDYEGFSLQRRFQTGAFVLSID